MCAPIKVLVVMKLYLFSLCNDYDLNSHYPVETFEESANVKWGDSQLLGAADILVHIYIIVRFKHHLATAKINARLPPWSLCDDQPCFVCSFSLSLSGMQKFVTEGQHLELTAITKEQSGSYECIASNDISSPDVRIVQVTVNCKGQKLLVWKNSIRTVGLKTCPALGK